jgi:curli biogenesis system outer membrane secretion channel CsgG
MRDMLATSLFNTNRYIVLERQTLQDVLTEQDLGASGRVSQPTAAPIGQIEGAELLVTGAVTEFEPGSSGVGGGIGGGSWGSVIGGVVGGIQKSHVAIDLRVVDTRTSRIVAATSVAGEATDFNLGGVLVGSHVGGGLGGYSKTPIEKAVRVALGEAVNFIVSRTPADYYHYSASGGAMSQPPPSSPAPSASASGADYDAFPQSKILYVTGNTANVRANAGKDATIVGTAKKGDALIGLGKKGDWYRVRMSNGDEGYIFQNLVSTHQ